MNAQQSSELIQKSYEIEYLLNRIRERIIDEPDKDTDVRADLEMINSTVDYMLWRMVSPRD